MEALGLPSEVSLHESDPPSPWEGYQRCLSGLPDCSHLLVVQDDAIVCPSFSLVVERVAAANDVPVCLFLARLPRDVSARATRALKENRRYVTWVPRSFVPVVALLWPREKAEEFMGWAATSPRTSGRYQPRSDDAMVGLWASLSKQEIRATVPSLIQHPDEVESTIGRRACWGKDRGRTAVFFAEDGLDYEW